MLFGGKRLRGWICIEDLESEECDVYFDDLYSFDDGYVFWNFSYVLEEIYKVGLGR